MACGWKVPPDIWAELTEARARLAAAPPAQQTAVALQILGDLVVRMSRERGRSEEQIAAAQTTTAALVELTAQDPR